jgi:hypothetical protein
MSKILLTHGDSFSIGYCPIEYESFINDEHRVKNWPEYLSENIDYKLKNLAVSSYSNDTIFRETFETIQKHKKDNLFVVIGWTSTVREEIYDRDTNEWVNSSKGNKNFHAKGDIYDLRTKSYFADLIRSLKLILLLHYYCESNDIPHLFFNTFDSEFYFDDDKLKSIDFSPFGLLSVTNIRELSYFMNNIDTTYFCNENMFEHLRILEDGSMDYSRKTKYTFMPHDGHPTELGQKTWAQYLYNYIKEKNIL